MLPAALLAAAAAAGAAAVPPGPGVPEKLANERAATLLQIRYELSFRIPARKTDPIEGREKVRFERRSAGPVVLDFDAPREHVRAVRIGGQTAPFDFSDGHLILNGTAGANEVEIDFVAGNASLNRNDEFLYTLFVPARAHLAFPCFDQPDLKARYTLSLEVPQGWEAVANGARIEDTSGKLHFAETEPLPTYLFAFAAGKFRVETAERNGRTLRMFHRETDAAKAARNRDAVFDLHARALAWLEDYTGIPYPWGKFDFVLIPSFQFGGMEHAGAILYNASSILLDPSATQNQLLGRASVIAHETAHMWFGDLVTMRWFNDVWMKEVMANFMAAKIVNPSFPDINHDLRFLLAHHPAAYGVDRTPGANPIRQNLGNLDEAGSLYGAIIYDKAPIVMRQLEMIAGEEGFRDGMREYLKKYSFANATWTDLIAILDRHAPRAQLAAWSRDWVDTRGRPSLRTVLTAANGKIQSLAIENSRTTHAWPQRLEIALGYADRVDRLTAAVGGPRTIVKEARGRQLPLYVLANGTGKGYGLFLLDDRSRQYLVDHIEDIPDPLVRGAAWVDLWENLLEGQVGTGAFLTTALRALPRETDQQNTQYVLSRVGHAWWKFLPPEQRTARAGELESVLRAGLDQATTESAKSAWFTAYRDVALTSAGLSWLEQVWNRTLRVPGLTLAEPDEIELALSLAVKETPHWRQILETQLQRTVNPDRKARFAFVMPALDADPAVRWKSFERFRDPALRTHEPWVLECMRYLNHPLREQQARRTVRPALDLLAEIQRTGDIFFPKRWADALLSGHRSAEAAAEVRGYLQTATIAERLRWVVESSADDLIRATEVVKP